MKLIVNGSTISTDLVNLTQLLVDQNIDPKYIVCEVDGIILDPSEFEGLVLKDGMTIELVSIVGGG